MRFSGLPERKGAGRGGRTATHGCYSASPRSRKATGEIRRPGVVGPGGSPLAAPAAPSLIWLFAFERGVGVVVGGG